MTSSDIQKCLYKHFYNYDYKLSNSFIFNISGECDFFGISKSGYQVEVEIKISRSDFNADFKKPKHKFYSAAFEKRSHVIIDNGRPSWPEPKSIYGIYEYFTHSYDNRCYIRNYTQYWGTEGLQDMQEQSQMLNNWPGLSLQKRKGYLYGDYHNIIVHNIEKTFMPHQLYYATPKGLILPDEVPKYAGLIYTDGFVTERVKKAPYMHKKDQNITSILLKKFYYECLDWRSGIKNTNLK
jgi:hypothetical protein